jgi:hypothetical protein
MTHECVARTSLSPVIPGRKRKRANPESRNTDCAYVWIPGPALTRRPGMTGKFWRGLATLRSFPRRRESKAEFQCGTVSVLSWPGLSRPSTSFGVTVRTWMPATSAGMTHECVARTSLSPVIPGRKRKRANPESRNTDCAYVWIPGPALTRRPGMTGKFWRGLATLRSFPRRRESRARNSDVERVALGPRFRGDERNRQPAHDR